MSSRRQARADRRRQAQRQAQLRNLGLIAVGAVIVVGLLIWNNIRPVGDINIPAQRDHPMQDGNALGDPNAPVVIEEFSDFQCSHCRDFYEQTEQALIDTYVATGQVRLIYRSFGNFLGSESKNSAEGAYCAGDQGDFWGFHDIVFENYSTNDTGGYSDRRLVAFAEQLGLNTETFEDCLQSGKYSATVDQDQVDGNELGIQGTPGFVVNGETHLRGNQPFSEFVRVIEAELAAGGN